MIQAEIDYKDKLKKLEVLEPGKEIELYNLFEQLEQNKIQNQQLQAKIQELQNTITELQQANANLQIQQSLKIPENKDAVDHLLQMQDNQLKQYQQYIQQLESKNHQQGNDQLQKKTIEELEQQIQQLQKGGLSKSNISSDTDKNKRFTKSNIRFSGQARRKC